MVVNRFFWWFDIPGHREICTAACVRRTLASLSTESVWVPAGHQSYLAKQPSSLLVGYLHERHQMYPFPSM